MTTRWFEREIVSIDIEPPSGGRRSTLVYGIVLNFSDQSRLRLSYAVNNSPEEPDEVENLVISLQSLAARVLMQLQDEVLDLRPDLDWRPPGAEIGISYLDTGEVPPAFYESEDDEPDQVDEGQSDD